MSLNSKHFATGSSFPPLSKGKIRIYSMRFCPYAERTILAAEAKKIPYEIINCNLKQKPEWLFEKNVLGKVPTVEILAEDGSSKILNESLIIADYFNEAYPEVSSLVSEDPFQRAKDRIWMEVFNKAAGLYFKGAYTTEGDGVTLDSDLKMLRNELGVFDDELKKRGTKFFGGNTKPGMLDLMMWPWIERLPVIHKIYNTRFPLDEILKEFVHFGKWIDEMKGDSTVEKVKIPDDIHYKYILTTRSGTNDYSLMEGVN